MTEPQIPDGWIAHLMAYERRLFERMIMTPQGSPKRKRLAEQYWAVYGERKAFERRSEEPKP